MSLVNMVLMASTWWASEPITAEIMPAPKIPASQTGEYLSSKLRRTPSGSGIRPKAAKPITPRKTQGSHITMMAMGYAMTVSLKADMRRAEKHIMAMCGNMMEESGIRE